MALLFQRLMYKTDQILPQKHCSPKQKPQRVLFLSLNSDIISNSLHGDAGAPPTPIHGNLQENPPYTQRLITSYPLCTINSLSYLPSPFMKLITQDRLQQAAVISMSLKRTRTHSLEPLHRLCSNAEKQNDQGHDPAALCHHKCLGHKVGLFYFCPKVYFQSGTKDLQQKTN